MTSLPPSRRRTRFRFSLLTLLLLTLSIGSLASLRWNCGPWVPALTILEVAPVYDAGFSPDDRLIVTRWAAIDHVGQRDETTTAFLSVHDAQTGQTLYTIRLPEFGAKINFSSDGTLIYATDCFYPVSKAMGVWSAKTGKLAELPESVRSCDPSAQAGIGRSASANGRFTFRKFDGPGDPGGVIDIRDGSSVMDFTAGPRGWKHLKTYSFEVAFAHRSSALLTHGIAFEDDSKSNLVTLWKKTRPVEFYGLAWLPEFWIAAALVTGLIWSFQRDRKMA